MQSLKHGFPNPGPGVRAGVCTLLLFALNASIAARLFGVEFTAPLHSPEGSFISLSRVMVERPTELLWWPYWNGGMPFGHAYLPLLQMIVAAAAKATGWPVALAYHAVTAFFYCLAPVGLFWLAWVVTGRLGASFLSGLLYSLVSPSALLFTAIRDDIGGVWNAQRLHVLVYYGAGPQVTALALLPLAILCLYLALERPKPLCYFAAGVSMAAVVLTNAFGAATLALAVFALLAARAERSWRSDLRRTLLISVLAYLGISFWLPPSLLRSIVFNAPTAGGDFRWLSPSLLATAGLLVAFLALWRLTRPWVASRTPLRFFLLFALLLTGIPALGYAGDFHILPQPRRYHLEMELALCLALVFALLPVVARLPKNAKGIALVVGLGLAAAQWLNYRGYARETIQPADLEHTIEYRMARRMTDLFGERRVMVSGSCSLWFNVFSDTPQLSGGHDPTAPNWMQRVAVFVIYSGMNAGARDGEIAVLWLKAFGAHGVNVPGAGSREPYKPFLNPRKFEGLLPVVWREEDDTIYRVPQRSDSLVYVVSAEAIVRRPPEHGLDVAELEPYVAALEDESRPLPKVTWRSSHFARIEASLDDHEVVSTQINYDPGWRATVDGVPQPTTADGLGLLVVRPDCPGPCEIELVYDGGFERPASRLVSLAVWMAVILWLAVAVRRSRA